MFDDAAMRNTINRRPWERTPVEYRERAEEARQMAAAATNPEARSTFLRVAESYEALAELAERRDAARTRQWG